MRKELLLCIVVVACLTHHAISQGTEYFLGAGSQDSSITVTTSHNAQLNPGIFTADGSKTVDGSGMNAKEMEAARFLAQATLGYTREMIEDVMDSGFETWIDSQFVMPSESMTDSIESIYEAAKALYVQNGGNENNYPSMPNEYHMDYTWWQVSVRSPNALRHRVAEALSQIIVVSLNSDVSNKSRGMAFFFDILVKNAFGNYEDILQEVAVNPAMGMYLTFVNNPATDSASMMFPDENFARECMQLFTIGLDELNLDGTPVLDTAGNRIPTYDNEDIAEFAKIFTGMSYGERLDQNSPYWGMHWYNADLRVPMIMYEEHHEQGPKYLLNGTVIPDGQTGMEDVEQTITHLFNHPNVGPFIAYRLIQRLVKSNPTPSYVSAVASAFNDNGSGERGDMKAVIKAILMHPEARSCTWQQHPEQGQLREPILRKAQFVRLFEPLTPLPGKYWNYSYWYNGATNMHPLRSPSVFNFYAPTFSPNGEISDLGLVAPEFGIYNSRTSIGYANQIYRWLEDERVLQLAWLDDAVSMPSDLTVLFEYAKDPDALMDHLDVVLTQGSLTPTTRAVIKQTLEQYGNSINDLVSKVNLGTYLVLVSPDYNILK